MHPRELSKIEPLQNFRYTVLDDQSIAAEAMSGIYRREAQYQTMGQEKLLL